MMVKARRVAIYLAWLVRVGFLLVPEAGCRLKLPGLSGGAGWAVGVGTRGRRGFI
ncbi:hypothetical protein CROQUDRAFT_661991 [Cronartium quercuum f. sp. fusiforme G11]|uniref:Uncharacterized protein n=1 Tax=Cronartium quercuum f. sp. fusiforme G11 TaxID=708437 RepID=A0A9P6T8Q8_9BASI|nr:hypothetical protein CROQUDRAFT_661991 [Cronartium quercuum f. sp. fusiforme G11]